MPLPPPDPPGPGVNPINWANRPQQKARQTRTPIWTGTQLDSLVPPPPARKSDSSPNSTRSLLEFGLGVGLAVYSYGHTAVPIVEPPSPVQAVQQTPQPFPESGQASYAANRILGNTDEPPLSTQATQSTPYPFPADGTYSYASSRTPANLDQPPSPKLAQQSIPPLFPADGYSNYAANRVPAADKPPLSLLVAITYAVPFPAEGHAYYSTNLLPGNLDKPPLPSKAIAQETPQPFPVDGVATTSPRCEFTNFIPPPIIPPPPSRLVRSGERVEYPLHGGVLSQAGEPAPLVSPPPPKSISQTTPQPFPAEGLAITTSRCEFTKAVPIPSIPTPLPNFTEQKVPVPFPEPGSSSYTANKVADSTRTRSAYIPAAQIVPPLFPFPGEVTSLSSRAYISTAQVVKRAVVQEVPSEFPQPGKAQCYSARPPTLTPPKGSSVLADSSRYNASQAYLDPGEPDYHYGLPLANQTQQEWLAEPETQQALPQPFPDNGSALYRAGTIDSSIRRPARPVVARLDIELPALNPGSSRYSYGGPFLLVIQPPRKPLEVLASQQTPQPFPAEGVVISRSNNARSEKKGFSYISRLDIDIPALQPGKASYQALRIDTSVKAIVPRPQQKAATRWGAHQSRESTYGTPPVRLTGPTRHQRSGSVVPAAQSDELYGEQPLPIWTGIIVPTGPGPLPITITAAPVYEIVGPKLSELVPGQADYYVGRPRNSPEPVSKAPTPSIVVTGYQRSDGYPISGAASYSVGTARPDVPTPPALLVAQSVPGNLPFEGSSFYTAGRAEFASPYPTEIARQLTPEAFPDEGSSFYSTARETEQAPTLTVLATQVVPAQYPFEGSSFYSTARDTFTVPPSGVFAYQVVPGWFPEEGDSFYLAARADEDQVVWPVTAVQSVPVPFPEEGSAQYTAYRAEEVIPPLPLTARGLERLEYDLTGATFYSRGVRPGNLDQPPAPILAVQVVPQVDFPASGSAYGWRNTTLTPRSQIPFLESGTAFVWGPVAGHAFVWGPTTGQSTGG